MLIGRRLNKNESGSRWTNCEPTITDDDTKRIAKGQRLEDRGFSLLADPTGENSIDDSFCVVTPSNKVLTPYEVYAFDKISCPHLSPEESQEIKDAHKYLISYSPEFFD